MSETVLTASSLRQALGAMIFSADRPVGLDALRKALRAVADDHPDQHTATLFAEAGPSDVRNAIEDLRRDLQRLEAGFELVEVAGGYRVRSQAAAGPWVRQLLNKPAANRLTPPAIETLAIIAYRQPIPRAEIESIRGVAVGHVLRALIELRLVRIAGRSDLPGRPFLYGTTTSFLEHFGLKKLSDLAEIDPTLLRRPEPTAAPEAVRATPEATLPEGLDPGATGNPVVAVDAAPPQTTDDAGDDAKPAREG